MNMNPSGTKTDALAYTLLRQAIGIMGLALPFVLILGACLIFHEGLRSSISDYYNTPMRDVYVGALWIIGFFLLSYHGPDGRNSIDDWAGNLACIFAVGASLFPINPPESPTNPPGVKGIIVLPILLTLGFFLCRFIRKHPGHKLKGFKKSRNRVSKFRVWILVLCVLLMVIYIFKPAVATITLVHMLFSLLFMFTLAIFALCLFTQTHPGQEPKGFKIKRNRVYRICGWIIVGCMALIDIYTCVLESAIPSLGRYDPILCLETIMVLSFGVSWWVKGEGLGWLNDRKA